jgi:glutamate dehydrogenase
LVLRDNYLQGEALSVAEARGVGALDRQARLIRDLERSGRLDRPLEFLPDDETLAARAAQRQGLVRPELAVLLAYAKLALDVEIMASDLPDAPELADQLLSYFPAALRDRVRTLIPTHPLRREITATVVTNDLVNRAGITFASEMRARTGRTAPEIARAYLIAREIFDLRNLWAEIEALDNKVPATLQTETLLEIGSVLEHAAGWLLRANRLDISGEIARFGPAVRDLAAIVAELLPPGERALFDERTARFAAAGVPQALAVRLGGVIFVTTSLEIGELAARAAQPVARAAQTFYRVGARLAFDELRDMARRLPAETAWQKAAAATLIEDFYALQADLAERILQGANSMADPLAAWVQARAAELAPADAIATDMRAAGTSDLAMLVVAARQLRQMLD